MNNFTNLKFYNFFVLSLDFGCAFKKKLLQFTCYITDILHESHFEMSREKLKNIHYFKSYSKFKKALNFPFFGNIFLNNSLKHFVLGLLNAKFCYLPYYFNRYFIN